MSKKSNTVVFMLLATLLNLVLMILFFIVSFLLISRFVDPESSLIPLWLSLAFIGSIGGSFLLYSAIVKKITAKFHLESKMAPLFTRKPKNRHPEENS